MPHILPVEKQNSLNDIVRLCNETKEPVFMTKNGEGALAILDMESYDRLVNKHLYKEHNEMDGVDLLLSLQKSLNE